MRSFEQVVLCVFVIAGLGLGVRVRIKKDVVLNSTSAGNEQAEGWWVDAWSGIKTWFSDGAKTVSKAIGDVDAPYHLIHDEAYKLHSSENPLLKGSNPDSMQDYSDAIQHCSWPLAYAEPQFDNFDFQFPEAYDTLGITFSGGGGTGIFVSEVDEGSVADYAGLKAGLVPTHIRGVSVEGLSVAQFLAVFDEKGRSPASIRFEAPSKKVRRARAIQDCVHTIRSFCEGTAVRPLELLFKNIDEDQNIGGEATVCAKPSAQTEKYSGVEDPLEAFEVGMFGAIDLPMPLLHVDLPNGVPEGTDIVTDPDQVGDHLAGIIQQDTSESRRQCLYMGMQVSLLKKKTSQENMQINVRPLGSRRVWVEVLNIVDGGNGTSCGKGEKQFHFKLHGPQPKWKVDHDHPDGGSWKSSYHEVHRAGTIWLHAFADVDWAPVTFPEINVRDTFRCDKYLGDSFRQVALKTRDLARSAAEWGGAKISVTVTAGVFAVIFPPIAGAGGASATGVWAGAVGINSAATAIKSTASGLQRMEHGDEFLGDGEFLWDMGTGIATGALSASAGHVATLGIEHVGGHHAFEHGAKVLIPSSAGTAVDLGVEAVVDHQIEHHIAPKEESSSAFPALDQIERLIEKRQEDLVVRTDKGLRVGSLGEECLAHLNEDDLDRHLGRTTFY